jgi:iron complex outermembrane receptor protein
MRLPNCNGLIVSSLLAVIVLPGIAISQTAGSTGADQSASLQEVVVTAQKRQERAQDVPVPVTVLSSSSLLESNKTDVKDYYTSVPGLSVVPGNLGGSAGTSISIRGLTTGAGNPTVGTVIDDVPFGSSTTLGAGGVVPEFDPSELSSIEVLRGPQGTLYGANSLGGLLKYVTVDPSTERLSGRIEAGTSGVYHGDKLGYNARGAINVPISDTLAVRASGFTREDPGYIDNVQTGQRDVNRTDTEGGRASALWRPSEDFSLKLNAMIQDSKIFGFPYTKQGLADLQQSQLRGTGSASLKTQAYSLTAHDNFGGAELTAISGYSKYQYNGFHDFTYAFGVPTRNLFGVGGDALANPADSSKFSQEVRLSVPIGPKIDWLIGAFYTHEHAVLGTDLEAIDQATGQSVAQVLFEPIWTTYSEYAAFTDLTYRFTDQFDVQFGARGSEIKQSFSTVYNGPYDTLFLHQASPFTPPKQDTQNGTFTYLVTPRFKLSSDLMLYARLASGYRPGGPSSNNSVKPLPPYGPDKTQNYEIGFKGDVLNHVLSFDTSIYYIDWKDIQLQVIDPNTKAALFVNGSRAKSEGVELSVTARPITGLTVSAWIASNDAELTQNLPLGLAGTAVGLAGDKLPDGSRFSGNFSMNQEFSLPLQSTGFIGGSVSYVGEQFGNFRPAGAVRYEYPAYARTDLRTGVKHDLWAASLFVNNITDRRGLLPSGSGDPHDLYIIQPRTIGINIFRTF